VGTYLLSNYSIESGSKFNIRMLNMEVIFAVSAIISIVAGVVYLTEKLSKS